MEYKFFLFHGYGGKSCGKPAYRIARKMSPGDVLLARDFQRLDGTPVEENSKIVCESCGREFHPMVQDIKPCVVIK